MRRCGDAGEWGFRQQNNSLELVSHFQWNADEPVVKFTLTTLLSSGRVDIYPLYAYKYTSLGSGRLGSARLGLAGQQCHR